MHNIYTDDAGLFKDVPATYKYLNEGVSEFYERFRTFRRRYFLTLSELSL